MAGGVEPEGAVGFHKQESETVSLGIIVKLISWNVAGWTGRIAGQTSAIATWRPDVLAIQEVTRKGVDQFTPRLSELGLVCSEHTLNDVEPRKKGVAVFSRWPLKEHKQFDVPFSRLALSVELWHPAATISLHNVHIPNGSKHKWKKIETFEKVYDGLKSLSQRPRVLCGDFNSPQLEYPDGRTIVWGEHVGKDGAIRTSRDTRWRDGERLFFYGLPEIGMRDIFRFCNGWQQEEFSWFSTRKKGKAPARRFDHIFADTDLRPLSCLYLHEGREQDLSDHSAIAGEFDLFIG